MSKTDSFDGVGYVICGYLNAEGPEGATAEAEQYSGHPFQTIEEAVAEIDANGGPRADATIFIGAVVPVGIVAQPDTDDATLQAQGDAIVEAFGSFYSSAGLPMVFDAGKGVNAPNPFLDLNNEGDID